jgi:glycosyltransferase involved in cell wall biosynthesis
MTLPQTDAVKSQTAQRRVLFISADPVGEQMAGLGIRYWELAQVCSGHARVTVAHGGSQSIEHDGLITVPYEPHRPHSLRSLIADADVVVTHPQWPLVTRWLRQSPARVIFDLYGPETFETLELAASRRGLVRRLLVNTSLDRLHDALRCGHHFMCASEKQRDLWLGAMLALRLIDPNLYDFDPSFRSVIDLVPFGLPIEPPQQGGALGPRELVGLDAEAEIVLWNGGIWNWLDAPAAIRAVASLAQRRPSVRLVFMGVTPRHPSAVASTRAARELARELGVLDSVVFFHEGWVPYTQRGAWLEQAQCAISTHTEHLESRFAYRTRLLDCFWAALPVVCTSGDDLAERVAREKLGEVSPPGDHLQLASALERVLERGRPAYESGLRGASADLVWPRVAQRLLDWIADPEPPRRPGDARGALGAPPAQRLREAFYRGGGRALLARRKAREDAAVAVSPEAPDAPPTRAR